MTGAGLAAIPSYTQAPEMSQTSGSQGEFLQFRAEESTKRGNQYPQVTYMRKGLWTDAEAPKPLGQDEPPGWDIYHPYIPGWKANGTEGRAPNRKINPRAHLPGSEESYRQKRTLQSLWAGINSLIHQERTIKSYPTIRPSPDW